MKAQLEAQGVPSIQEKHYPFSVRGLRTVRFSAAKRALEQRKQQDVSRETIQVRAQEVQEGRLAVSSAYEGEARVIFEQAGLEARPWNSLRRKKCAGRLRPMAS